jgi:uncharacterized membrane protein required for colicin V production
MNIVDIVIFLIMSVSIIFGMYNGLVLSALHTVSFFLSWLLSLILYPALTNTLMERFPKLLNAVTLYTEGSAQIPTVEERMTEISSVTLEKLTIILEKIQLPNPFTRILLNDFSLNTEGVRTLGEYFDSTMAITVINIFSFLILFMLIKIIFVVIISIGKTVVDLPVLKKYDSLAGGGLSIIRGVFMVYLVFALIPIVIVLAPVDLIKEFLDGSKFADFFLNSNIFSNFVKGR